MMPDLSAASGARTLDRRRFMTYCSSLGLGGTLLPEILWQQAQQEQKVTKEMLVNAEAMVGLSFSDEQRDLMLDGLNQNLEAYQQLRAVDVPNGIPPALVFDPVPGGALLAAEQRPFRWTRDTTVTRPTRLEEVAFWPVTRLAELVRSRQVSSVELTQMYLDRLKRYGTTLQCVVTVTEELALRQARRADDELAHGRYRGPLHGIPWGAKDLLAVHGYPTTWGAKPYEQQMLDQDATVVKKLEDAGAVLIAKLTLGALAMGDVWFGGTTKNPWNLKQGSSGSSAGPGAATVAGLVGFSIGSETLGSIISPSTRCGDTGLRPTFGRVSRYGAMALSWSMDKLGPMCRAAEDCALVLEAIRGADAQDPAARNAPFNWDPTRRLSDLRVGYLASAFREDYPSKAFDAKTLEVVRGLGADLVPVELPDQFPIDALRIVLSAEAAAAFDQLTRSDAINTLVRQDKGAWPNSFRRARFIPAVEYIQANRVRTMVMGAMHAVMEGFDVVVSPTFAPHQLLLTNLTGHPVVVVPNGYTKEGTPVSISFIGRLYDEASALAAAKAYQDATDFHLRRPPSFT